MKKLLTILLILAMMFSFAACGSDTQDDGAGAGNAVTEDTNAGDEQEETVPEVIDELVGKEMITLHWNDQTLVDGDRFGATDFEDFIVVRYDGEVIGSYLVMISEESLGNVVVEYDGRLFLSARKEGECQLTIEYGDASATFEWYTF